MCERCHLLRVWDVRNANTSRERLWYRARRCSGAWFRICAAPSQIKAFLRQLWENPVFVFKTSQSHRYISEPNINYVQLGNILPQLMPLGAILLPDTRKQKVSLYNSTFLLLEIRRWNIMKYEACGPQVLKVKAN